MWKDELLHLFSAKNIKFNELADLRKLNSMRIGGRALVLVEPVDEAQLIFAVREARRMGAPVRIMGGMTNTLVADGVFTGVIVRTVRIDSVSFTENNEVCATCGASLGSIVLAATNAGVGGFSELVGIPGTLGGALYGNAGAHGRTMADIVVEVDVYDVLEDKKTKLTVNDIDYGYRDSLFKHEYRYLILSARLRGFAADKAEILANISQFTKARRQRQPLSLPSLGSIFKHPVGDYASRLIESLGLKGFRIGGAEVSQLHAGFIVNNGDATASDVKDLINSIKIKVYDTYGIDLEEEINYLV
jgi:UDP-N-acetylmuramate dehydrogenase